MNLISTSKTKIDVCGDRMIHIFPYLITEEKFLHELYESKHKGIKIRYIIEVTYKNIDYCRKLLEIVDPPFR